MSRSRLLVVFLLLPFLFAALPHAALPLVTLPLAVLPARAEEKPAAPRIAVEPESFDFGKALQDKVLRKEFTIRNFGGADLVIEQVSTSCGCTAALVSEKDRVIKPGGSAPLKVELSTRQSVGRIAKSVLIRSNDREKKLLELKVEATVVAGK